jgi:hypothetical protein
VTRIALLLALLALGALGLLACDDDDTATAETEVITSNFGKGSPGRGRLATAAGPDVCGDYRKGPGGIRVELHVVEGVVRCSEMRRVLKNQYHGRNTPPWSCVDYGDELVQCTQPGVTFSGILYCRGRPERCPGFGRP